MGVIFSIPPLLLVGIILFSAVVFFQVINLPVEFDASARAKRQLVDLGLVPAQEMTAVNRVLNAAALTYVAATCRRSSRCCTTSCGTPARIALDQTGQHHMLTWALLLPRR
jgi:hypothetical protein